MSKIDWKSVGGRLRVVAKQVARLLFTKDTATFFAFFLLATLFWVMYNVGAHRTTTVEFPVRYTGIPRNVLLAHDLPASLAVVVKDEGQVLINYKLLSDDDTLLVDLTGKFVEGTPLTVDFRAQNAAMQQHFPTTSQILSVKPESATVGFVLLEQKTLPVRLSQPIPVANPYVLLDSVRLKPAAVEVFAPRHLLDTLQYVEALVDKSLMPLMQSATFRLPLQPIAEARLDVPDVEVRVPIEMSTEKTFELPVQGRNFPDNVSLRAFPATVTVVCAIGVSRFEALSATDFAAYVDYADIQKNTAYKVPVTVVTDNAHIRTMRYSPTEVEFLLEK